MRYELAKVAEAYGAALEKTALSGELKKYVREATGGYQEPLSNIGRLSAGVGDWKTQQKMTTHALGRHAAGLMKSDPKKAKSLIEEGRFLGSLRK